MTTNDDKVPGGNRFSPRDILVAHAKGLRNRQFKPGGKSSAAKWTRVFVWGLPPGLGIAGYFLGATVTAIDGLLAAAGVLAGGLFMGFTQVAAWRERYTARTSTFENAERPQRYSLDETVAHVLMATYGCLALVVIVVVGANFADDQGRLTGTYAALTIVAGSFVILLLAIILPKLYAAYAVTHEVDDEMSGLSR